MLISRLPLFAAIIISLLGPPSCQKREQPSAPAVHAQTIAALPPWPDCPKEAEHDRWYRTMIQSRPAGTRHIRVFLCRGPQGPQKLFTMEDRSGFLRSGQRIVLHDSLKVLSDSGGTMLRLWRNTKQAGQDEQILHAGKIGQQLVSIQGPEKKSEVFEPESLDINLFAHNILDRATARAGASLSFRSWSPFSHRYESQRVEIRARSSEHDPLTHLVLFPGELPGMRIQLTLDRALQPQHVRTRLGDLSITWSATDQEPQPTIPSDLPELSSMMRIETRGEIERPDGLKCVQLTLADLPPELGQLDLSGPGQQSSSGPKAGSLHIKSCRLEPPGKKARSTTRDTQEGAPYLGATALAQSDDPQIKNLARTLTKGLPDDWARALALRTWVAQEIDSDMGFNFASATTVLRAGAGDCSEKAVLLAALARAVDIPARVVGGLVYHQGSFSGHMWTEVLLDRWRPLDAALGGEQVNPARIRLGVHPLSLKGERSLYKMTQALTVSGVKVVIGEKEYK